MSVEYRAEPNKNIFIRLQLARADTGMFPQCKVYAIDDPTTVVDTIELAELDSVNQPGLYGKVWTNDGIKQNYYTQTQVFTDSYGGTIHPIIRPDSDSINVGFNNAVGGSARPGIFGKKVTVERLTKKEIKAISEGLFELIKPELDKKSEFNPAEDIVKTDIVVPEIEFPEAIEPPSVEQIAGAMKVLLTGSTKDIKEAIENSVVEFPAFPDVPTLQDIANTMQDKLDANAVDYNPAFDELKEEIINNKVTVPEPVDYSPSIDKTASANKSLIGALLLKDIVGKVDKKKVTVEDVMAKIKSGALPIDVLKEFNQLSAEDKNKVFNSLATSNKAYLKRMVAVAKELNKK